MKSITYNYCNFLIIIIIIITYLLTYLLIQLPALY